MDKFLTFPGQQPIYLGDIDFMQTAVGVTRATLTDPPSWQVSSFL